MNDYQLKLNDFVKYYSELIHSEKIVLGCVTEYDFGIIFTYETDSVLNKTTNFSLGHPMYVYLYEDDSFYQINKYGIDRRPYLEIYLEAKKNNDTSVLVNVNIPSASGSKTE